MTRALLVLAFAASARAEPVSTATSSTVVRGEQEEAPGRGPPDAPVEVEVFCTVGNSGCHAAHDLLRQLARRHPARLRVVYRIIPAYGVDGQAMAEAAFEAWRQGMFFPLLDAVGRGSFARRDLEPIARRVGIDVDELRAALADRRHARRVERDVVRRDALGLTSVPALVWNGVVQHPGGTLDAFERVYDAVYARARAALSAGVPPDRLQEVLRREAARERQKRDRGGGRVALDLGGRRVPVSIDGAPARGEGSDVTIVMFGDFECLFCRRTSDSLRKLEMIYPGRVRVAFKHFPMPFHRNARLVAEVAACAHRQGKFWALHDALYGTSLPLTRDNVDKLAVDAGLDTARLWSDVQSGACAARVQADLDEGRALGVEATPTMVMNGLKIPGTRSLAELRAIVGEELGPGWLAEITDSP